MNRGVAVFVIAGGLFAQGVSGQNQAPRPRFDEFEVATIKPTNPEWKSGRFIRMQTAHQLVARNHALRTLIAAAYNLNVKAISGGEPWVDDAKFDILAKAPGETRPNLDEQMAMLRKLLAERFGLVFHREEKTMPVFTLSVDAKGSKLKPSPPDADAAPEGATPLVFVLAPQLVRMPGRYVSIDELASVMQRAALSRPVVNKTGLTGRYDFDLQFTPDESLFGGALGTPKDLPADAPPDLFGALRDQLGLRMEATRGPVLTLVIDQANRPTEN